jgi:capsid protein
VRSNHHKKFEDEHRENNLIHNRATPEYIAQAAQICSFLCIEFVVSAYEADSQVMYDALPNCLVPITGDSDLLAIASAEKPGDDDNTDMLHQLVVVNKWQSKSYHIINLDAPHTNG